MKADGIALSPCLLFPLKRSVMSRREMIESKGMVGKRGDGVWCEG